MSHFGVFPAWRRPSSWPLITSSAYFYFREQRGAAFPWSAVALAAASMTRPEGLVAVGVTGAFVLFDSTKLPRRDALRHLLPWAAAFLSLYGPFFIWRYSYYGYLFPNTYYAKVGLTVDALDRGLRDLATSGLEYHLLAMVVGTIILLTHERLRQDALYILALAGGLIAAMVVEGDVGGAHNRFIGIVFPLLFLGGVSGLATLLKRAALPRSHHIALASVALTLGALALLPASYDPLLPLGQEGIERRSRLGAWFNEYTPADYRIADFAIGAISYHAIDRDFIDLLGLSDVTIAHTEVPDMGAGIAGHEKYNIDYVFEEARPEIIVTGEVRERPFSAAELRPLLIDRAATPAALRLFADTRLWDRYTLRAVELEGLWYHFMQRNDTVAELQDPGLN